MRCLGRTIVIALLLGLLWWRGGALWQHVFPNGSRPSDAHVEQLEAASARFTYKLDEAAWTLFAIPPGAASLRVATNANLPSDLETEPDAEWRYAVSYELLDAQDRVQAQRVYYHRSRITRHADPEAEAPLPAAFYLDAPLTPADTRTFVVDLAGFPAASRARFRLHAKDEAVQEVALSLYTRKPLSEHQADYLWRRLPDEQKQGLAKGLAYSMAFLEPSEQLQLLKNRWQALGPKGIEGQDYQARKLYTLDDIEPEDTSAPTLPSGLIIDARHDGVMEIPAEGLSLRLNMVPLSESHRSPNRHGVHLTWYGEHPQEQSRHHAPWQDGGAQFEGVFSPGLLVLHVLEGAAVAQAFRRDAAGETPWVIEPRRSRMYLVEPDRSVEFTIAHSGGDATPCRIDVRHLPSPGHPANTNPLAVRYEMLNAAGEVTQTGRLASSLAMSRYDRIPRLHPEISVSDPSTSFFAIPPQVARLRFRLPSPPPPAPILVAVWNRPADLIRELYIGNETDIVLDRDTGDDGGEAGVADQRQWAWFPKRPDNARQLVAEKRSHLLHIQPRPPEDKLALLAEPYQVEPFRPEGMWRGRHLFLPREPHQTPLPPQALAIAYQPLRAGREQRLVLGGLPQRRFLQPTLMYFNASAKPQPFEVIIDGATQRRGALAGRHGEIDLPTMAAGAHRILVQSPPATRWFMSHIASGAPSHVKRLAYRLDASGLTVIYERQQAMEETLSMRWHAPYGAPQATHLYAHLELEPTSRRTPSPSWTFNERRYVLAPVDGPPVPVLNTGDAVDAGQPFFFPIGHDAPAGRYRLRLRLEQGAAGYITLVKLNRGLFESRRFTGERAPYYVQAQP